jgi:hypothetical protein
MTPNIPTADNSQQRLLRRSDTPLTCLRCILPEIDLRARRNTPFVLAARVRLIAVWALEDSDALATARRYCAP